MGTWRVAECFSNPAPSNDTCSLTWTFGADGVAMFVEVAHYLTIGDTQDAIAFAAQKSVSRLITLGSIADEVRIAIYLDNEP